MREEMIKILKMVEEGTVSTEQALELLDAMNAFEQPQTPPPPPSPDSSFAGKISSIVERSMREAENKISSMAAGVEGFGEKWGEKFERMGDEFSEKFDGMREWRDSGKDNPGPGSAPPKAYGHIVVETAEGDEVDIRIPPEVLCDEGMLDGLIERICRSNERLSAELREYVALIHHSINAGIYGSIASVETAEGDCLSMHVKDLAEYKASKPGVPHNAKISVESAAGDCVELNIAQAMSELPGYLDGMVRSACRNSGVLAEEVLGYADYIKHLMKAGMTGCMLSISTAAGDCVYININ